MSGYGSPKLGVPARVMGLSSILVLIVTTSLIRLVFAATTGLGVDESYMVAAGRVAALGYFDHPPAAWWLSWGAAHLLGTEAPIAVRLPFILLFAVSQMLVWRIGCRISGCQAGFWAAVALNLSPVFGVTTASWVLPDGPLDTALLGAALCLLRALAPGHPQEPLAGGYVGDKSVVTFRPSRSGPATSSLGWWAGAGLCAGLAVSSKYSAILPIGGTFGYLLTDRTDRRWLARAGPYVAVALAGLVFCPVLIWNALHGWASFAFQGDRAIGLRFHPLAPLTTLAGEALFVLPWVWLPMMILFVRGLRRGAPWTHRLLAWLAAPAIVGFAMISAWSSQRVLFHWAAPGYLMLFPLVGQAIGERLGHPWVRRLLAATVVVMLATLTVISTQLQFDWLGSTLTTVMRRDPTDEGLDWTSVRDDLSTRGLLPPGALTGAISWRDAGKFGYALGPDVTMLCLSTDARQFGFVSPLRNFAGQTILLLVSEPPEQAVAQARHWFRFIDVLPATSVRLRGRVLRSVTVLRGTGFLPQP